MKIYYVGVDISVNEGVVKIVELVAQNFSLQLILGLFVLILGLFTAVVVIKFFRMR